MYHQIIYRSRYRQTGIGASATVRDVVAASERNNCHNRITGYLIFDKTHFLQILEGDEDDVERTFLRISCDRRHEDLTVLVRRPVAHRAFSEWHMGGAIRSPEMEAIFRRHAIEQGLDKIALSADEVVALTLDIANWEIERRQMRGLSGH